MIQTEKIARFQCCSIEKTEHFVQEPKLLKCGHYVCSKCINTKNNDMRVMCGKCGQIRDIDETNDALITGLKQSILENLKDLAEITLSRFDQLVDSMRGMYFTHILSLFTSISL